MREEDDLNHLRNRLSLAGEEEEEESRPIEEIKLTAYESRALRKMMVSQKG